MQILKHSPVGSTQRIVKTTYREERSHFTGQLRKYRLDYLACGHVVEIPTCTSYYKQVKIRRCPICLSGPPSERARLALQLQSEGRSLSQIGERLGISKQAVHDLLRRAKQYKPKSQPEDEFELKPQT